MNNDADNEIQPNIDEIDDYVMISMIDNETGDYSTTQLPFYQ